MPTPEDPEPLGQKVPGDGKVLVPVHLDEDGNPDQWMWCRPEAADGWDVTRWRHTT